jgi:NAD-dependent SIR2 family protein deacetylase
MRACQTLPIWDRGDGAERQLTLITQNVDDLQSARSSTGIHWSARCAAPRARLHAAPAFSNRKAATIASSAACGGPIRPGVVVGRVA